eukprot:102407_1
MESALKQSQNIHQLLTKHQNEIKEHSIATKAKINVKFNGIIQSLQKRQKILMNQVDGWETEKLNNIGSEISQVTQYNSDVRATITALDDLLTASKCVIEQRERKIIQVAQTFCNKNSLYQALSTTKSLTEYLDKVTKLSQVIFLQRNNIDKIDQFGSMVTAVSNAKYQIPTLLLTDVIKSEETNKGIKVSLQWDMISSVHQSDDVKENDPTSGFVIKYMQSDEKVDELNGEWLEIDHDNVKTQFLSRKKEYYFYICDVNHTFECDIWSHFKVERLQQTPVDCVIVSNVKPFECPSKSKLVNVCLSKQKEIKLQVHSCQGYYGEEWKAENVLKPGNSYYCSKWGVTTNDWIIFEYIEEDIYYCPVSLKLKAWDGNASVQQFNVCIGSVVEDKWMRCNEETFVSDRSQKKEWQVFDLDFVRHNNKDNEANKNWQQITR